MPGESSSLEVLAAQSVARSNQPEYLAQPTIDPADEV